MKQLWAFSVYTALFLKLSHETTVRHWPVKVCLKWQSSSNLVLRSAQHLSRFSQAISLSLPFSPELVLG